MEKTTLAVAAALLLAGACGGTDPAEKLSGTWTGPIVDESGQIEIRVSFDLAEASGRITGTGRFTFVEDALTVESGPVTGTYKHPDVEMRFTIVTDNTYRVRWSGKRVSDNRMEGTMHSMDEDDTFPLNLTR